MVIWGGIDAAFPWPRQCITVAFIRCGISGANLAAKGRSMWLHIVLAAWVVNAQTTAWSPGIRVDHLQSLIRMQSTRSERPITRGHVGVIFTVQSLHRGTLVRFFREAVASATRLKLLAPKISTALAIGPEKLASMLMSKHGNLSLSFDYVLPIPRKLVVGGSMNRGDGFSRQWFTRILTMARLPFSLSVFMDSHATVCSVHFQRMLLKMAAVNTFDIAFNPTVCGGPPHNWLLVLRDTNVTRALMSQWILEQSTNIMGDDQHTLGWAIDILRRHGVPVRTEMIGGAVAALRPGLPRGATWPRLTNWLQGEIVAVHTSHSFLPEICGLLNRELGLRALVIPARHGSGNKLPGMFQLVHSDQECNAVAQVNCSKTICSVATSSSEFLPGRSQ